MSNWIKLYSTILEWEWYKNQNTKDVFLHCLLKANWKEGNFQGIVIPRGSFVTSINTLSNELNLTNQNVRTALKNLKKTKNLTIKTTNKFSIITINNYDNFQIPNKQLTNNQQTTNNQPNNNSRQYRQIDNISSSNSSIGQNKNLISFVEKVFGRTLNPLEYEELLTWKDSELTRYAIKLAVMNGTIRLNYIKGILNTWKQKNIKTVQEAQKEMEDYKKFKTKKEDQRRRPTKKSAMDRFRETLDNWEKKMEEVENDNKGS